MDTQPRIWHPPVVPYDPPADLAALTLAELAEAVAARRLPPVERWNPTERIDSGMRIATDGKWYHLGAPIARPAMVRAFSSLLWREPDGSHWLRTPQDWQAITVDDAAFVAVDLRADTDTLTFRLNTDELVMAGPDNPLRIAGTIDAPAAYLTVRYGLEARLDRSTWTQLAELALAGDGDPPSVVSRGARFVLVPA